MLQELSAKVARDFQTRTQNPEIAQLGWPEILAVIMELLKVLLPLLNELCPMEAADVKLRAIAIRPLLGKTWWARRQHPFMIRWYYAQFHRLVSYELRDLEIDSDEIEGSLIAVCATLTEHEIQQVRAEITT